MGFKRIEDKEHGIFYSIGFDPEPEHSWLTSVTIILNEKETGRNATKLDEKNSNPKKVRIYMRTDLDADTYDKKFAELEMIKPLCYPKYRKGKEYNALNQTIALAQAANTNPNIIIKMLHHRQHVDFELDGNISDALKMSKIPDDIREAVLQELQNLRGPGQGFGGR
jgi:hypothetical protein